MKTKLLTKRQIESLDRLTQGILSIATADPAITRPTHLIRRILGLKKFTYAYQNQSRNRNC